MRTTLTHDRQHADTTCEIHLLRGPASARPARLQRIGPFHVNHPIDHNIICRLPDVAGDDGPHVAILILRPLVISEVPAAHLPLDTTAMRVGAVHVLGVADPSQIHRVMRSQPGTVYSSANLLADLGAINRVAPINRLQAAVHPGPDGTLTIDVIATELTLPERPAHAEAAQPTGIAVPLAARGRPITLHVGDPAPPLHVASWVHGTPVDALADGNLTVVEFAYTWNHLTHDSLPRLGTIARRFAQQRVQTIGIRIAEGQTKQTPGLPAALEQLDQHHLGIDDRSPMARSVSADAWLKAAGCWLPREERYRTPMAFIVGGDGRIRWIGDPRRGVEDILQRLLDGTWVGLSVVAVDSEQISDDEQVEHAVDGDPLTIWHTQWRDGHPTPPHEIVLALSQEAELSGITYLPRQNSLTFGTIADYAVHLSRDGVNFGDAVASGSFPEGKALAVVAFSPQRARFIKLRALSEVAGHPWASAAEIGIIRPGDPPPVMPAILPLESDEPTITGADDF